MSDEDEHSPSFDLPSPSASAGAEQMEQRIASRLFPSLSDERVGRATPHYVAHYRVLRKLGRGGMGVVYAAEDQKLGRVVAIKLLHRRELSERGRQRLVDEARTLAKLSHPNVVHVYEVGEQAQDLFIAMEFIEGETLAKWQRERRQRTELLGAYLQAGAGLVTAHRSGIVHCDFKPANVLVGRDGRVRVVDFGLAREDESASTDRIRVAGYGSSSIAQVAGTPGYAAPELFIGRPASASSDQFSFCVALWEALSGVRPFEIDALTHGGEVGRLPGPRGTVRPRWLRRALLRGLAADPSERWPAFEQLLRHIERRLWLRRIGWLLPLMLATAGLAIANLIQGAGPARPGCDALASFDSAWSGDRKQQLLGAAAGDSIALATARTLADELDWYAASWSTTQQRLCREHFEDERLSAEGYDLAQHCLLDARARASALVDSLIDDGVPAGDDTQLLDALPPPVVCGDMRVQRAHANSLLVRLGTAATVAPRLQDIELTLARGEFAKARRLADALVDATRDRPGLAAAHAQALLGLALAEKHLAELDPAQSHLEAAAVALDRARLPERRFHALRELAELLAYELEQPEAASLSLALAEAPLRELGKPAHLVSDTRMTAALIAETAGEHERAELLLRDALAMQEHSGAHPRQLARTRLRIANSLAVQGRREQALALYDDVLDDMLAVLHAGHPELGTIYFDIGLTWTELERWVDAQHFLGIALEVQSNSYGPDSVRAARVATALACVETELGHHARAIELARRALRIQAAQLPVGHLDRAAAQATYAWALLQAKDLAGALIVHLELLDELPDSLAEQRPALHVTIAWLLCRLRRGDEARPHIAKALLSSEPIVQIKARMLAVELELADDPRAASRSLDDIELELSTTDHEADEQLEAELRWLRARIAIALGQPRPQIEQLVRDANELRDSLQPDQLAALE